jgi:hypothetical protein
MPTRQQNVLASAKAKKTQEHHALETERLKLAEEQRLKREKEKKTRDEARKRDEEARKQADDIANQEYSISTSSLTQMEVQGSNLVSPTDGHKDGTQLNLNLLLQQGGLDNAMDFEPLANDYLSSEDDDDEENDREERSPAKKKGKKKATFSDEPTRSKTTSGQSKITAQKSPEIPQDKPTTKQPKSTTKTQKSALKSPSPHFHTHSRVIVEAMIQLSGDNPCAQFVQSIQELLRNGQIVDKHFAYVPIKSTGAVLLSDPSKIPVNMTVLGAYFKYNNPNGRSPFERQKDWKNKNKKSDNDEYKDPLVYFTMAIATDEDPGEVVERIRQEWGRIGGKLLRIKELQSFDSESIFGIYSVSTQIPKHLLLKDLTAILCEAQAIAKKENITDLQFDPWDLPRNSTIPPLDLRLSVPKIPGQDTSQFNKLEWRVQNHRKVYHIECDKRFSTNIKRLITIAKDMGIVDDWWGKHSYIGEVLKNDASPSEINRLCSISQTHTGYQGSMIVEEIIGITMLNASVPMMASESEPDGDPISTITLRQVLRKSLKIADGNLLFAQLHQLSPMSPVYAVSPNTPQSEQMIHMMNKNFPAYLTFVLQDQRLPKDFISELIRKSCCQTKAKEIHLCTWDSEKMILTTPKDKSTDAGQSIAQASWFKDAFADLNIAKKGKGRLPAPPPESLFNLAADRSVKTIHDKPASTPKEGKKRPPNKNNPEAVNLTGSDEESAPSSGTSSAPHSANTMSKGDSPPNSSSDEEDDSGIQDAAGGG